LTVADAPEARQDGVAPASAANGWRESVVVALALLLLALAAFAPWLSRLGLLHDDWPLVHDMARGLVPISSLDGLRPLLGLPWRLCGLLFGDALVGYYLFLFALQWLGAVLLFLLARRFAPAGFAAALAALAMVYPADASHLWLSTLTQRTAWVLALAAVLLAELGRERVRFMLAALALGLSSLGFYELQLPLLALWPAFAWGLRVPWRRRSVIVWSAMPALYLTWRFVIRPLLGAPMVATATFRWDAGWLARRAFLLVPYNLFADGWLIGATEAASKSFPVVAALLVVVSMVTIPLAPRWAAGLPPSLRYGLAAGALVVLGVAPIVPTTYWLGRTAGTFGARILAAALPGAALLVLLGLARVVQAPRARALAFSVALTLAFAFHWNVGALAAENWVVQQRLARALLAASASWPRGSFLVIVDLPPNRLSYDTPWGVGRMIRETYGDETLSGIGTCSDRPPREILSIEGGDLLVQGGFYARVSLAKVVTLRWRNGALEPLPIALLLKHLGPRPE
jgi:hypothetical protein